MDNNVNTSAKIISTDNVQPYQFNQFVGGNSSNSLDNPSCTKLDDEDINDNLEPILLEVKQLANTLAIIQEKVIDIENNGIKGRDLDKQVVQAIKDLKNYASFFEQASLQMEAKLLKTSLSIAKKIIAIEVGENSSAIAKQTISTILEKIKTASKVTIHLNPKDYTILKNELDLEPFILLNDDQNVTMGGVVVASDLGNFDGSIEAKVKTLVDSLDMVI